MIYVVVGMHKSGTTLVSEILHRSGISMGQFDESLAYDQGNQYERRAAFDLNLEIFGCPFEEYFSTRIWEPPRGPLPEALGARMRALAQACAAEAEDWGFKDPLTALTYPLWAERLPPHRVVGVYRDPAQVLAHYRTRAYDWPRAWRVLRAWCGYNRGVLAAVRARPAASLLLRYEALMSGDDELRRLREFAGRPLVDARKTDHYRARGARTPFRALVRALGWWHGDDPARILAELDALRAAGGGR